tara:strand:- start:707 stop:1630 length:924 start_codon:yes stop_codon:yes gene_type:complete
MRSLFAKEITAIAKNNKKVVLLSGDIGNRMFDAFKKMAPERFINCGIAEANMMSLASGMALCGLRPVIYTITPFTTTRCLEQIKIGAAYHNANLIIIGTGSGLSYSELGPTHHSFEDIAIIRSIPGIRVLTPADPEELKIQINEALTLNGPTYIRIGKKGEPLLFNKKDHRLGIAKGNILKAGNQILILGIGPIINEGINAAKDLEEEGISVSVASMGSVRPLDEDFLKKMAKKNFKYWITLEEHSLIGGFGSTILEWLLDNNMMKSIALKRLGIRDEFIHELGNQNYIRNKLKIDKEGIKNFIKNL